MAAPKKYRPISLASVLVETVNILDAIRDRIGITETVYIPAEIASTSGLRKKEYSVFWNWYYQGMDGERPVFISLRAPGGKELNSLIWTLQTCIKVHNAIVALYNEMILKK